MKKYIIALGVLCLCLELVAQSYPKKKNAIRILTYNTHYCKGASDPGEIAKENIEHLAQIIKTLDADIVALQELDSASVGRGNRYLLKDIADATGCKYILVYGNAAPFDGGSIGCGVLVKKKTSYSKHRSHSFAGRRAKGCRENRFQAFCLYWYALRSQ